MTWFLISQGEYPEPRPWVLAETVAELWARETAAAWPGMVALSETEALLHPEFRQAVEDWRRRDDSAFAADEASDEASWAISNAAEDPGPETACWRSRRTPQICSLKFPAS